MNKYIAYTDGSANNKSIDRFGGSAYIIIQNGEVIHRASKGFKGVTNNEMELMAIISAVYFLPDGAELTVYTDSRYAITVFSNRAKRYNINMNLISKYRLYSAKLKSIKFVWVKGHNGDKYNEMVDRMARGEYNKMSVTAI